MSKNRIKLVKKTWTDEFFRTPSVRTFHEWVRALLVMESDFSIAWIWKYYICRSLPRQFYVINLCLILPQISDSNNWLLFWYRSSFLDQNTDPSWFFCWLLYRLVPKNGIGIIILYVSTQPCLCQKGDCHETDKKELRQKQLTFRQQIFHFDHLHYPRTWVYGR